MAYDPSSGEITYNSRRLLQLDDETLAGISRNNLSGYLYKKAGDDGLWWAPDQSGTEIDLTQGGTPVTWANAVKTANQTITTDNLTSVTWNNVTGPIQFDGTTGFNLIAGKTYTISFTPQVAGLTGTGFVRWSIRNKASLVQLGDVISDQVSAIYTGQSASTPQLVSTVEVQFSGFYEIYNPSGSTAGNSELFDLRGSAVGSDTQTALSIVELGTQNPSGVDFNGATETTPGTQGLVPAPSAGQQFATLLGNGLFQNLSESSIIDMYSSLKLDWTAKNSPGLLGINIAGSASYNTSNQNNYFINIVSGGSQSGYINFDAGQAYEYFKFEVYYKILNTTQPADVLGFFGCGTQVNSGTINNTGGLTFDTDYFNGGSFNRQARFSDGAGNALVGPYQNTGYQDIDDSYYKFTMTRFENNVSVDIVGNNGKYTLFKTNFTPTFTGTRFGIFAQTGASSMNVEINSIKLIAF
jgi:hypothetical protein